MHYARRLLLVAAVVALTVTAQAEGPGYFEVDHIDGLIYEGDTAKVQIGRPIVYHIRMENTGIGGNGILGMRNAFRVYGPLSFQPVAFGPGEFDLCGPWFSLVCQYEYFSCDGIGADTVGFKSASMADPGVYLGFNEVVFAISTQVDDPGCVGQSVCLDSAYYPGAEEQSWVWVPGYESPAWNGPICYEIAPCCVGIRGNINGDIDDQVDIQDLLYLVSYMFSGDAAPPCQEEADVNASGTLDIQDLVGLVSYMFEGGPPPIGCP